MSDWQKLIDRLPRGPDGRVHANEPFDWDGYIAGVQKQRVKNPWRNPVIYDSGFADAVPLPQLEPNTFIAPEGWVQPVLPLPPGTGFMDFTVRDNGENVVKWQPALMFEGVRVFFNADGKLDVEVGVNMSMTDAAQLFIDEMRRLLGGSMPSLDLPPPTLSIGRHTLLRLAQRAVVTLDCGVTLIDADDFPREKLTTPEVRWGDPAPEGAKQVIVDAESYARWLKWRDDRCLRFGLQPDLLEQFRPKT